MSGRLMEAGQSLGRTGKRRCRPEPITPTRVRSSRGTAPGGRPRGRPSRGRCGRGGMGAGRGRRPRGGAGPCRFPQPDRLRLARSPARRFFHRHRYQHPHQRRGHAPRRLQRERRRLHVDSVPQSTISSFIPTIVGSHAPGDPVLRRHQRRLGRPSPATPALSAPPSRACPAPGGASAAARRAGPAPRRPRGRTGDIR